MRKQMKKFISLLAVCLLAASFLPSAYADEWHWYPVEDGIVSYVDGETYWLSLDEEKLTEYADLLTEELELPSSAVAGVLANLQFESAFNPKKIGDDGFAYGLCQWRGPRLDAMVLYCQAEDLDPISLEGQLQYLIYDLRENYIYGHDLLLGCNNTADGAVQAAFYFCSQYEAPSNAEEISPDRELLAKNLIFPLLQELRNETE